MTGDFKQYRRKEMAELRPFVPGEGLLSCVSVSQADREAGSPKWGDMIARNPKNHADQWLVAAKYFADNFEPVETGMSHREGEGGWISHKSANRGGLSG